MPTNYSSLGDMLMRKQQASPHGPRSLGMETIPPVDMLRKKKKRPDLQKQLGGMFQTVGQYVTGDQ